MKMKKRLSFCKYIFGNSYICGLDQNCTLISLESQ